MGALTAGMKAHSGSLHPVRDGELLMACSACSKGSFSVGSCLWLCSACLRSGSSESHRPFGHLMKGQLLVVQDHQHVTHTLVTCGSSRKL